MGRLGAVNRTMLSGAVVPLAEGAPFGGLPVGSTAEGILV